MTANTVIAFYMMDEAAAAIDVGATCDVTRQSGRTLTISSPILALEISGRLATTFATEATAAGIARADSVVLLTDVPFFSPRCCLSPVTFLFLLAPLCRRSAMLSPRAC